MVDDLPEILWHMSDRTGSVGIVRSQTLWASDTRYLPDTTEFSYSRGVLARVTARLASSQTGPEASWLLEVSNRIGAADEEKTLPLYAASLCAVSDLPSQWTEYASGGTGFAIGFDRAPLYETADVQQYSLGPLIYDVRKQEEHFENALLEGIELVPQMHNRRTSVNPDLLFALAVTVTTTLVKNPAYQGEHEWRLMRQQLVSGLSSRVRFREPGHIPYEPVSWRNPMTGDDALVQVLAGPNATAEAIGDMRCALDEVGLSRVPVSGSTVA
jgi:hypothetical protein